MPIVSVDSFAALKYDYLVLGGGTAGLALAARYLSDNCPSNPEYCLDENFTIDLPKIRALVLGLLKLEDTILMSLKLMYLVC